MKVLLRIALICSSVVLLILNSVAQTTMLPSVVETLQKAGPVQPHTVTEFQLEQYLMARIPPLPHPSSRLQWTAEEATLRKHILNDIAFHGWPREWIDAAPNFQQVGVIHTTHGYKILKLRYEIVPGFYSTALLYEPDHISGKSPGILNLLGHEPESIAVEYEQKRCINFAKRGIIALDLGWMGFGELSQPENNHDFAADLDLVGSNAFGLFYLSMKRGLDYLASLPQVDPTRIGATGLSGGGWQTTVLGALDPRIAVSVEAAGIGSRESNLTNPRDTYEIEEDAPDLMRGFDYPEFVAMRAPRPTMLIHNAVDSCCFRAPLVKPYIYDNVKPFFKLYGKPDNLAWHMNLVPGVHNYQLDNRVHAYQFFTRHFHMPVADTEIFSDSEIHTAEELAIGVPPNNQTILGLAREIASQIHHEPVPTSSTDKTAWDRSMRDQLKSVVRYKPVSVTQALRMANSRGMDFHTLSYRFGLSNGLSAAGIWLKQDHSPNAEPVTIILDDRGYKAAGQEVFQNLTSGHDVLALDLLFNGASKPEVPDSSDWVLLVDSSGDRSLGLQAAQLIAVSHWLRSARGATQIQIETSGIRSQVIALVAAALEPEAFSTLSVHDGMKSLKYLLDKPVPLRAAPELFCLDLYKFFDIDSLRALAPAVTVTDSNGPTHPHPGKVKGA